MRTVSRSPHSDPTAFYERVDDVMEKFDWFTLLTRYTSSALLTHAPSLAARVGHAALGRAGIEPDAIDAVIVTTCTGCLTGSQRMPSAALKSAQTLPRSVSRSPASRCISTTIPAGSPLPPGTGSINVRSSRYFIVESRMRCDQCNVVTAVFGFALPADYESLYVDDDAPDDESGTWESPGIAAVLSYVDYLPEAVADRIRSVTQHYRLDLQSEAGGTFWMNHCEHCGAQMEEEELHGDPGSPFGPCPTRVWKPFGCTTCVSRSKQGPVENPMT
jgi:hypothetical protein